MGISPVIDAVGHVSMCVSSVHLSSLGKYLFRSPARFLKQIVLLLPSHVSSACVWDVSPVLEVPFVNTVGASLLTNAVSWVDRSLSQ